MREGFPPSSRCEAHCSCSTAAHFDLDGLLATHDPDRSAGVVRGQALEEGRALPPVAGERGAPGEVSELDLPIPGYQARLWGQYYSGFDGFGELLVGGHRGYVRREVTGVLDGELDPSESLRELFCL